MTTTQDFECQCPCSDCSTCPDCYGAVDIKVRITKSGDRVVHCHLTGVPKSWTDARVREYLQDVANDGDPTAMAVLTTPCVDLFHERRAAERLYADDI